MFAKWMLLLVLLLTLKWMTNIVITQNIQVTVLSFGRDEPEENKVYSGYRAGAVLASL